MKKNCQQSHVSMKKNKKIILISAIILLFLSIILLINPVIIDKYRIIIENKITEKINILECNKLNKELDKDMCFFYLNTKNENINIYPDNNENYCNMIENRVLKFICKRFIFRPHMLQFISKDVDDSILICKDKQDLSCLYNYYLGASEIALENLTKTISYCKQIGRDINRDECLFYAMSSFIIKEPGTDMVKLSEYCDNFSNPLWTAECYYLIADEVARNQNSIADLEVIGDMCEKSTDISNYLCFNHVLWFLDLNSSEKLCKTRTNKSGESQCYSGLGYRYLLLSNFEPNLALNLCEKIDSEEGKKNCMWGVIYSFGKQKDISVNKKIKECQELEIKKDTCIYGLSTSILDRCDGSVKDCLKKCETFPLAAKNDCYLTLGRVLGRFSQNTPELISKCFLFPNDYQEECFNGLSLGINDVTLSMKEPIKTCNQFPQEYKKTCFINIGKKLQFHFGYDKKRTLELCNSLGNSTIVSLCIEGLNI